MYFTLGCRCLIFTILYKNAESFQVIRPQGICIFGDSPDCFFKCHCSRNRCQEDGSSCQSCDPLTGACFGTCKESLVTLNGKFFNPYIESYWSGPGCQVGNIAINKSSEFEIGDGSTFRGFTDGSFQDGHKLGFTQVEYWLIDLENINKIQFIDFIIQAQNRKFDESLDVFLETRKNGRFENRISCRKSAGEDLLKNQFPYKLLQIHYTCSGLSTGNILKVQSKPNIEFPFFVNISEVIIIGNRNVQIVDNKCIEKSEPSSRLKWCKTCNSSLPPDCSLPCSGRNYGINCENKTKIAVTNSPIPTTTQTETAKEVTKSFKPETEHMYTTMINNTEKVSRTSTNSNSNSLFTPTNIIIIAAFIALIVIIVSILVVWHRHNRPKPPSNKTHHNGHNAILNNNVPLNDLHIVPPPPPLRTEDEHASAYCEIDEIATPSECLLNRTNADGTVTQTTEPDFKEAVLKLDKTAIADIESSYINPVTLPIESSYLSLIQDNNSDAGGPNQVQGKENERPVSLNMGLGFKIPTQPKKAATSDNDLNIISKNDGYLEPRDNDGYLEPRNISKSNIKEDDYLTPVKESINSYSRESDYLIPVKEPDDYLHPLVDIPDNKVQESTNEADNYLSPKTDGSDDYLQPKKTKTDVNNYEPLTRAVTSNPSIYTPIVS